MAGHTHFGTVSQNKRFQQFAFCTRSGKMLLLDHDFSLIANREIGTKVSDVALYDLTADGERKIVLTLEKGGELVLKPDLEPLAFISPKELPAGFGGIEVNVGSRERARFALLGTTTVVGSLEPNPSRFARWFRLLGNILAGLAAIAIVGYIALRGVVYRGVYRALGRGERNVGLLLLTRHGRVVEVNEGLWNLLQLQHDIKPGRRWQSVFTRGEIAPFADFLKRGLAATMDTEGRMDLSMEGTTSNFVVRSYPIFIGPIRTGTLIALGDLTKTFQADRLMNWALVAQNLAHEMKTPLSTIRFTLERIRQALRTPKELTLQEVEPHLGSIEEEVQRLDQYVRGFLKLANLNPPNFQRCDINAVLDERLSGYGEKMPPSIRLEKEYAQELPLVDLDVNLFTTVVTNLLDNALAAMKGEGKLRISTYLACMLNREWVCCSFADTGCGIADADIAKVFEPYFTKASAGTGLGLVITKKIVEDHGGSITFHTRLGFGTEFIVRLPGRDRGAGHG
jgi:signal transduction histidine kinase